MKDNNRLTPLHLAAQSPDDRDDVVLMLIEAGADTDRYSSSKKKALLIYPNNHQILVQPLMKVLRPYIWLLLPTTLKLLVPCWLVA